MIFFIGAPQTTCDDSYRAAAARVALAVPSLDQCAERRALRTSPVLSRLQNKDAVYCQTCPGALLRVARHDAACRCERAPCSRKILDVHRRGVCHCGWRRGDMGGNPHHSRRLADDSYCCVFRARVRVLRPPAASASTRGLRIRPVREGSPIPLTLNDATLRLRDLNPGSCGPS
jgi:hypothetical protein